jgi:uncharacterized protein (TIGR03435 family)
VFWPTSPGSHRSRARKQALALLLAAAAAPAQSFEVASIKVNTKRPDPGGWSVSDIRIPGPGRVQAINANLFECLQWAYQLSEEQISGPDWLKENRPSFDIEAKAAPETPGPELRRMLQTLLTERFRLQLRRETRVVPGYELVTAKGGPKLPPAKSDAPPGLVTSEGGRVTGGSVTAARLARALAGELKRPVADKTGIEQRFSFELNYSPEGDNERPSLFTALERTLGLKLTGAKLPVDFLIVESAQRLPAEN